jgi:hypothetical protein
MTDGSNESFASNPLALFIVQTVRYCTSGVRVRYELVPLINNAQTLSLQSDGSIGLHSQSIYVSSTTSKTHRASNAMAADNSHSIAKEIPYAMKNRLLDIPLYE